MKKINNPIPIKVKGNKVYFWCACGKSSNQPFCDGSHKNTNFSPVKLESLKNEKLIFWIPPIQPQITILYLLAQLLQGEVITPSILLV